MAYIIALSVIAGALGIYYCFFKDLHFFKKHGIPYKTPLPVLGNMGSLFLRRKSLADIIKTIYDLSPDAKYVGMFETMKTTIVLRDPELIKSITTKHFNIFMDHRTTVDETQDPFVGKNLFNLRGDRWREMKSILSPAFTSSKMKSMFELMSDYGVEFVNYLTQLPAEKRMEMDMRYAFSRYSNDIIASCAFGVSVNSMKNPENEFYLNGTKMLNFNSTIVLKFIFVVSMPWLARILKLKIVPDKIINFFRDLLKSTIKTRDENGIVRQDVLQLMMETRGKDGKAGLTIDDMVAQAFFFFFAGFETVSGFMCYATHEIAINQGIQERLQNEIDEVLEKTNGQASYEAINNMEYLGAVVDEVFRKYPASLMLDRLCLEDFQLPPTLPGRKSFTIKKGQGIVIPVYGLHYDPQYFEEPEKFDPERFLGEKKNQILNCGVYLPFGQGPRMCIGRRFALMETKVLLFHLLARCDLKPCAKTTIPFKMRKGEFVLKPEGGFWLNVLPKKTIHRTIAANVNETCQL